MKNNIKIYKWKNLPRSLKNNIILRSTQNINKLSKKVIPIIENVKKNGDKALLQLIHKFDKTEIKLNQLKVTEKEINESENKLSENVKKAIQIAIRNVTSYHKLSTKAQSHPYIEISNGIFIAEHITPIDSVALYIPYGKGSFPSMVYMLGIPAKLAGVSRRVMVSPPQQDGNIDPACLFAAKLCDITEIYKMGGAHAIAALTYGTKSIKKVSKIIGPASSFVSAAKRYVSNDVDVDIPAGPSESIIIADGTTPAELVAYDLCIEAEHGEDSMAIVLVHKKDYAKQIVKHLIKIISEAPKFQKKIVLKVLEKYQGVILTESEEQSIEISNLIAPEHLMIHSDSPNSIISHITNAGEILIGKNTPFTLANYGAGANAVIPTGGQAKTHSAVSIDNFIKKSSIIKISHKGFLELTPHVRALADYERFYFHEKALAFRNELQEKIKE